MAIKSGCGSPYKGPGNTEMNDTSRQNPGYRSANVLLGVNVEKRRDYNIGEIVWIHIGGPGNVLRPGKIVHHFMYHVPRYVIEVETGIEPILEVREWDSISENATGPINLFRGLK